MNTKDQPAWALQARKLFELMCEQAVEDKYGDKLWQGKLTDLYHDVGASNANYTRIVALLIAYEVIEYVQRGNRYQPTIIRITGELQAGDLIPPEHLTEARSAATLVAAQEIEPRVKSLEAWRESLEKGGLDVAEVLRNYELRITKLEREQSGKKKK